MPWGRRACAIIHTHVHTHMHTYSITHGVERTPLVRNPWQDDARSHVLRCVIGHHPAPIHALAHALACTSRRILPTPAPVHALML